MNRTDRVRVKAGMGAFSHCVGQVRDVEGDKVTVLFIPYKGALRLQAATFYTSDIDVVEKSVDFTYLYPQI